MKKKKHKWRIDAGSLASRKRARIPMPPPTEKHRDRKNDYKRENNVNETE
jgi:hypothetical protein